MAEQKQQLPELDEIAILEHDQGIFQGFLNVLENPDKILRLEAGGDITVYDDIGREPRIGSNLRTRAQAVIGKEWELTPASEDRRDMEIAAYVKEVFLSFPFDAARRAILRGGVLKGYAVSEIMWEYSEGDISIREMKHRAQRRFRFDMQSNLRMLTATDALEGINLSEKHPRKFQTFVFGDEPETPYGVGLGRELYWPWWFKKNGIKFWLQFCERFGSPTGVGKYQPGATKDQKAILHSAIDSIRRNASIIIPDGMSIELLEAGGSGSVSTQSELVRYMDELISICILGQTASTQGTPGRLGGDETQENVRDDLVKADSDALTEYLNYQAVRYLVDYQFPGHGRYPRMWIRAGEEADLNKMAERDKNLRGAGVKFKKNYYVGTYGFAEDEFEIDDGGNEDQPTEFAGRNNSADFAQGDSDVVDNQVEQLGIDTAAGIEAMVDVVRRRLEGAKSLEEFRDKILEASPNLDAERLAEVMAQALASAELMGRYEVLENIGLEVASGSPQFAGEAGVEYGSLPFAEQIEFFRNKLNLPTAAWTDIWQEMHSRSFVVAGAMRDDLLADLRSAIEKAITQGTTLAEFRKDFDALVEKHGWTYNGGRNWRTRVIYDTNLRQSYNAGRDRQMADPELRKMRPYGLYRHGHSIVPRQEHLAWDGIVLPLDDPWWQTHTPSNGWGCHCKKFMVSAADVERMGLKIAVHAPPLNYEEVTVGVRGPNPRTVKVPAGIDPGFAYNPGTNPWGEV